MPNKAKEDGDSKNAGKGSVSAPAITLPKGGGAIRGIGEKFAANPVTGTGSVIVPIATSPGRSGFEPQLSLSYDSGSCKVAIRFRLESLKILLTREIERHVSRLKRILSSLIITRQKGGSKNATI
jgi:hypothetical protein